METVLDNTKLVVSSVILMFQLLFKSTVNSRLLPSSLSICTITSGDDYNTASHVRTMRQRTGPTQGSHDMFPALSFVFANIEYVSAPKDGIHSTVLSSDQFQPFHLFK